jgi:8-oxo-dGTP pyrophosphatase MutT (NUDIX family)
LKLEARHALLDWTAPLRPDHAVAALIQLADGRYVLQQRDIKANIFYPDHWGCFGGAVDAGESEEDAIVRELREELGVAFGHDDCEYFTEFTFDFGFVGYGVYRRRYFVVKSSHRHVAAFTLGEGAGIGAFTAEEALVDKRLVPYDGFAIWLHHQRKRLAGETPPSPLAGEGQGGGSR